MALDSVDISVRIEPTCNGDCDGFMQALPVGDPISTIDYAWTFNGSPIGGNTISISGLCAGDYQVTATDTGDATSVVSPVVALSEPTATDVSIIDSRNETCSKFCDGYITFQVTGGTPGYNYHFSGPNGYTILGSMIASGDTYTAGNLCPGDYSFGIVDSNGCQNLGVSHTITAGSDIVLNGSIVNIDPCVGVCSAQVQISPSGGAAPYDILWNTGETTQTIANLCSGQTVTVQVTDDNGCTRTGSFTIPTTPNLTLQVTGTDPTLAYPSSGTVQAIAGGGQSPYTYLWNTGDTTATVSGLSAGTYTCTLTDDNGCVREDSITLHLSCDFVSFSEFKVFLMRTQCCLGKKIKKNDVLIQEGRQDLADKELPNLYLLRIIFDRLRCIADTGSDTCWSCDDIQHLMSIVQKICDCDCCAENEVDQVQVQWNEDTNMFDVINN